MKKTTETTKKNTVICTQNCTMEDSYTHSIEDTDYSTIVELIHRILIETDGEAI
jgi:hypothetical protein